MNLEDAGTLGKNTLSKNTYDRKGFLERMWVPLVYLSFTPCWVPDDEGKEEGGKLRRPLCETRAAFCNPIITGSSGAESGQNKKTKY